MTRRRYHFHLPGLLYVVVTFFLAVGAINSQNNLLFASLGLAMGGLLVSGVLSGAALIGLRVERVLPGSARVGGREAVVYRAKNVNRVMPAFGLTITEAPGGTWKRFIGSVRGFVAYVGAGGESETRVEIEPRRRGRMTFEESRVFTTFPFGLAKKSVSFEGPGTLVVHPVELRARNGLLKRMTVRAAAGVGSAVRPGLGDDFYGLREYVDGDNPRWIAWRRSARTGQMVVRQNTTPTPRSLWIVIRIPDQARSDRLEERAIAIAAAVAREAIREGASVGLAIPALDVEMRPRADARGLRLILDRLAVLELEEVVAGRGFPTGLPGLFSNTVIHAGEIDRAFGTSGSYHVAAGSPGELLVGGAETERALALLDAADEPGAKA